MDRLATAPSATILSSASTTVMRSSGACCSSAISPSLRPCSRITPHPRRTIFTGQVLRAKTPSVSSRYWVLVGKRQLFLPGGGGGSRTWPYSRLFSKLPERLYRETRRTFANGCSEVRIEYAESHVSELFALAGCPRSRKVLGYFPSPQILNEPKSFTQGPSGASGSDSRQTLSW